MNGLTAVVVLLAQGVVAQPHFVSEGYCLGKTWSAACTTQDMPTPGYENRWQIILHRRVESLWPTAQKATMVTVSAKAQERYLPPHVAYEMEGMFSFLVLPASLDRQLDIQQASRAPSATGLGAETRWQTVTIRHNATSTIILIEEPKQ